MPLRRYLLSIPVVYFQAISMPSISSLPLKMFSVKKIDKDHMNSNLILEKRSSKDGIWLWNAVGNSRMALFLIILLATIFMVRAQAVYDQVRHPPEFQRSRCNEWEFSCKDGNCIARYDQCDGIDQCPDGSDEEDCHRYEQHHNPNGQPNREHFDGRQQQEIDGRVIQQKVAEPHQQRPSTNTNMASKATLAKEPERHPPPMQFLLIGASAFVIVAIVVHVAVKVKRRKKNMGRGIGVRGFRNGESLIDDEDDLLISQAYN